MPSRKSCGGLGQAGMLEEEISQAALGEQEESEKSQRPQTTHHCPHDACVSERDMLTSFRGSRDAAVRTNDPAVDI